MLHVAVAVILDFEGRVLLSRRLKGTHLEGLWEFPGGKLEPGESLADGLVREIDEELGITVESHRPLIRVRHSYAERDVLLDVHMVEQWSGKPQGREGQEVAWVAPGEIGSYQLPPADLPIVTALSLPDAYMITPALIAPQQLLEQLHMTQSSHKRLLQLRLPAMTEGEIAELVTSIRSEHHDIDLLVKDIDLAARLDCGVHLSSAECLALNERPLALSGWVAASCHSLEELQHAMSIGVDFATLSPVEKTSSHPDAEPLGWNRFAELVEQVSLPVYALGGLGTDKVARAWAHGAQGIAGISTFFSA